MIFIEGQESNLTLDRSQIISTVGVGVIPPSFYMFILSLVNHDITKSMNLHI